MPSITSINLDHLHLLLNHIPTVGSAVALGILIVGFVRRDGHLKHVGLEVLFVIAVLTMPVYMTGVAAYYGIRRVPGLSETAMRIHQDAALLGFTVTEIAGFVGWIALWQSRRHGRPAPGLVPVATLLLVASLAVMARAANLGGEIRHPEIRTVAAAETAAPANGTSAAADDGEQFVAVRISQYMVESPWAWPAAEAVHFLGLCLSFGVLLAINLRILGVMRHTAFGDLHRLLPWGMLGFGGNFITGMLFFIGQPNQYLVSTPFYWKVVLLVVAGANFLYLTVFAKAWARDADRGDWRFAASLGDKVMAVSSIAAWLGVLYAGRMLPFLGRAF